MFQSSVQLLVILQVLRGSECQESKHFDENIALPANIKAQSLDIIGCFTEAVNISWHFSDEQTLNVSYFQYITDRCDRNSWRIYQCNYPLIDHLQKAENLSYESYNEKAELNDSALRSKGVEHYEKAVELMGQATLTMKDLIHQIRYIKQVAAARNEFRIFTDNCSLALLDMDTLLNQSLQYTTVHNEMRNKLEFWRLRANTIQYYLPPFIVVVFTFGMLGNGLLLLIFVRHPKSRMGPNVMLVNLAVSDSLFLLVNIAIEYYLMLWEFPFGIEACYVYNFFLSLITVSTVYSMTILSFSRYIVVTAKLGNSTKKLFTSMPVMLTTVWILSSVVAIPDTLSSELVFFNPHNAQCIMDVTPLAVTCDFLFISILPLTAITCFYIAASRRLRRSVRKMPGQALGQEKVKMARERGAKILPGLIFVFAITFLPFYTYCAIVAAVEINYETSPMAHTLYFVVYFLFNLNSALNPVSLYLTSGMFRSYINNYITLGLAKKQKSRADSDKSYTVSSKL